MNYYKALLLSPHSLPHCEVILMVMMIITCTDTVRAPRKTEEDSYWSSFLDEDNVFCCCVSVGLFCDALIVVFQSFVSFILTRMFWALIIFPLLGEVGLGEEEKRKSSREWKERIHLKRETNNVLLLLINHFFIYLGSLKIFMVNGSPPNLFKIHCVWNLRFFVCLFFIIIIFKLGLSY